MEIGTAAKIYFTKQLTAWHRTDNNRDLPWKNVKDPYKIWLSEIILQQTRALQGLPYYERFITTYPTIADLAAANDDDVFRLWQGLGYYNRCKNMLATARLVVADHGGVFPATHEQILSLKGIGPYTAAAIASFAYGLPHSVVDGNVYRVLARYFGIETPTDTTEGKKQFSELAQQLLQKNNSAAYNQAIMDLGATICTPRNPLCNDCPLQKNCVACHTGLVAILPIKLKKITVRKRHFHYLLLKLEDTLWVQKRSGNDIWENLHQPYLIEYDRPLEIQELLQQPIFSNPIIKAGALHYQGKTTQRLTHQLIEAHFYSITLKEKPLIPDIAGSWLTIHELKKTAFPKTVLSFLENNLYF